MDKGSGSDDSSFEYIPNAEKAAKLVNQFPEVTGTDTAIYCACFDPQNVLKIK